MTVGTYITYAGSNSPTPVDLAINTKVAQ